MAIIHRTATIAIMYQHIPFSAVNWLQQPNYELQRLVHWSTAVQGMVNKHDEWCLIINQLWLVVIDNQRILDNSSQPILESWIMLATKLDPQYKTTHVWREIISYLSLDSRHIINKIHKPLNIE